METLTTAFLDVGRFAGRSGLDQPEFRTWNKVCKLKNRETKPGPRRGYSRGSADPSMEEGKGLTLRLGTVTPCTILSTPYSVPVWRLLGSPCLVWPHVAVALMQVRGRRLAPGSQDRVLASPLTEHFTSWADHQC